MNRVSISANVIIIHTVREAETSEISAEGNFVKFFNLTGVNLLYGGYNDVSVVCI
jgi:hypothetical protein